MSSPVTQRIETDDVGVGEPAVVLIPGWCGDRTVFQPLLPPLSRRRRTIAVDLPEHGRSPRTGADVTTSDVVDALVELADREGVERMVPVGLSHAGWAAIELRRRLGQDRVPGIVLLDWMPLGTPPGFADALVGLQDEAIWEQVRGALFGMWTTGVDVAALHRYVASMGGYGFEYWRRAGREIQAAFDAEGSPLAALERLPVECPTLHIYAQPTDDGFLAAQQGYAAAHPWYSVRRVAARSHFPMFEVPEEIAAAIEGFTCGR